MLNPSLSANDDGREAQDDRPAWAHNRPMYGVTGPVNIGQATMSMIQAAGLVEINIFVDEIVQQPER